MDETQRLPVEKKQAHMNKTAATREYLRAHPGASATEVVKALNEQGIMVSLALVCLVRAMGHKRSSTENISPKRDRQFKAATHSSSKAQAIREAMQRLGYSGETGAIIADLEKRGIVVAAAQVASVRSRMDRLENR